MSTETFSLIMQDKAFLTSGKVANGVENAEEQDIIELTKTQIKKWLTSESIIFLSGAGTSKGYGGKLVKELWEKIDNSTFTEDPSYTLELFCTKINFKYEKSSTQLENLLSFAEKYIVVNDDKEDLLNELLKIKNYKRFIESIIKTECSFDLNNIESSPHYILLQKLARRPINKSRFKLFTLNYDTAFEQAAYAAGLVVIDGFSYTQPRLFNGKYFDYDFVSRANSRGAGAESYIENVLHIYKLHGSVSWESQPTGEVMQFDKSKIDNPLMVYPNSTKYELSYQAPFFEMISRFQQELRRAESTTLIIAGFGLGDNHIMAMINETLMQKSNLQIIIVNPTLTFNYDPDKRVFSGNDIWSKYANIALTSPHVLILGKAFNEFVDLIPYTELKTEDEIIGERLRKLITKVTQND